jgi:hypothetical protein
VKSATSRCRGARTAQPGHRCVSAKLRFTLVVSYHMIVPFVVSSPKSFPNGKDGIMDIGPLDLEPISRRNWAAYAVAVIGILATFQKPEKAAC